MFVSSQEERLRDRKTESEENLQKRLNAARVDMKFSKCSNIAFRREKWQLRQLLYVHTSKHNCFSSVGQEPGVFDAIIVNDNLEDAYEQLKSSLIEVRAEPVVQSIKRF